MSKPAHAHAHTHAHTLPRPARAPKGGVAPPSVVSQVLSLPPKWLHMYDEFITRNAHQVSQIESALRSLTYIIPGSSTSPPLPACSTT